jgi:hypothetical protein
MWLGLLNLNLLSIENKKLVTIHTIVNETSQTAINAIEFQTHKDNK